MTLTFDPGWVLAYYYTSLRVASVLLLSPLLAGLRGLQVVRVLLCLGLSGVLTAGLAVPPAASLDLADVVAGSALELLLGATLAYGVFAAFGAFTLAGKLFDVQAGLGLGSIYDPVTRSGAPLLGTLLNLTGVAVFYALDGHTALLRGLAYSLERLPPGSGWQAWPVQAVIAQFGIMFSLGVALMIPVLLCLLLLEVGLAVLARSMPQMNVFVIGIPVKLVAGLLLLALGTQALSGGMARIFAAIFRFWEQVAG